MTLNFDIYFQFYVYISMGAIIELLNGYVKTNFHFGDVLITDHIFAFKK